MDDNEKVYALMMAALDDELDDTGMAELETYLGADPALAQEWHDILYVDQLLVETPPVFAPINFTERTLARLPNPQYRRVFWVIFGLALALGVLIPIIALAQFSGQWTDGSLSSLFSASYVESLTALRVVGQSILSLLSTVLVEQPIGYGVIMSLLLVIAAWFNVYRYLSTQTIPAPIRVRS